jgi:hypothetical protein
VALALGAAPTLGAALAGSAGALGGCETAEEAPRAVGLGP